MGDEVKKVEGGAGPDDRVKSLEDALATEKAKNEVLMEQILKSENTLAEKDVEGFADVIPNEDRDFGLYVHDNAVMRDIIAKGSLILVK